MYLAQNQYGVNYLYGYNLKLIYLKFFAKLFA